MELDVRTYAGLVGTRVNIVKDTHQRATLSTYREGDLRNGGQGRAGEETEIGMPFFGIAKSKRPSRVLAAVN